MPAKKGNKNALKHGFYAQRFTPEEIGLLDRLDDDILHEIKLLRAFSFRIAGMLENRKEYTEDDRALLALLTTICATIGGLTTRRAFQTGKVTAVQDAITTAIMDLAPVVFPNLVGK